MRHHRQYRNHENVQSFYLCHLRDPGTDLGLYVPIQTYAQDYFGTMLVKMGYADALLGGATYSTADTVRPALQIIKTKPGSKIVSSCFIMVRPSATGENEVLAMADCAINIKPTEDELVEIAVETARTAKVFGIDPKVAFLSYSTLGSGKGEDVDKMRNACEKAKAAMPDSNT